MTPFFIIAIMGESIIMLDHYALSPGKNLSRVGANIGFIKIIPKKREFATTNFQNISKELK